MVTPPRDTTSNHTSDSRQQSNYSSPQEIYEQIQNLFNQANLLSWDETVQRLSAISLRQVEQLDLIAKNVFERYYLQNIVQRRLSPTEACDLCADMLSSLQENLPSFPGKRLGEKPSSIVRSTVNMCQKEFFRVLESIDRRKDSRYMPPPVRASQNRQIANLAILLKFIGGLVERRMMASKVMEPLIAELIGYDYQCTPADCMVEMVCELLIQTGQTLNVTAQGRALLQSFESQLGALQHLVLDEKEVYPPHIQSEIQSVLDLKQKSWIRMAVQLEETSDASGDALIIARTLSGDECGTVQGQLCDLDSSLIYDRLQEQIGVSRGHFKVILPSGSLLPPADKYIMDKFTIASSEGQANL